MVQCITVLLYYHILSLLLIWSCLSVLGFSGLNCEVNVDDCPGHKCMNGGICVDGVNTYNCQCQPEWTGIWLSTLSKTCVYRIWDLFMWLPWAFVLSGQYCAEDVNECLMQPNACHNGGTCFNTNGGHTCVCVNGWTGNDCSENIDDCATAVCFNGATCHDRVASFFCECPVGKTGMVPYTHIHIQIVHFTYITSLVLNCSDFWLQVCCATLMMPVSVTPAMKVRSVTPTRWMAVPSAHVQLALSVEPVTRTWTSVLSVLLHSLYHYSIQCTLLAWQIMQ